MTIQGGGSRGRVSRNGEDGGHHAHLRDVHLQHGVGYHDWGSVRQAVSGQIVARIPAHRGQNSRQKHVPTSLIFTHCPSLLTPDAASTTIKP